MKIASRIVPLLAFLAVALAAPPAQAEPENPIVRGTLDVAVNGGGKITGTGIDCGTDCTDSASWRDNEMPPKNMLTATPSHGWAFSSWTHCAETLSGARCNATYSEFGGDPVTANFADVMAPSIFISSMSPADEISTSFAVEATSSDNDRVTRVEFLIDGSVVATDHAAPWSAEIDTTNVDEGTHQLQARAFDPTGNNGITANWPITIDHTGPAIQLSSPVAATGELSPRFSFSSADGDFAGAECAIKKKGSDLVSVWCARDEWFSAAAPTEGEWEFVVVAEDRAGNSTTVTHEFIVDRTAPVATMTSGPADGSMVEVGNVKYEWTVTDALPVTQTCVWDNGEETTCDGSAARGLTAGPHSFKVVFTDLAGNKNVLARTFTVKRAGNTPDPDDDQKPDPDTSDRTAPVIKLVAPKQKLAGLRKALKLNVRCSEACAGQVVIKGGGVRFAGRVNLAAAGVAKLKLRPTAQVRRKVTAIRARGPKARLLKLVATANLKDRAGNGGRASLKFRVKD